MISHDGRQAREAAFHQTYAQRNRAKIDEPVPDDIIQSSPRRPWNAYWCTYDALLAMDLHGKKALVPGCGFGDDAIRLAVLGADVYANDLSEDILEIARARAERAGLDRINFKVMPAESSLFDDDTFDLVFFNDILHHVDIARTLDSTQRVLKPGGRVIINELYTHSALQKVRNSKLIRDVIYPRMMKFIYNTDRPYITEDERKINEAELASIERILEPNYALDFFLLLEGRIFPSRWPRLSRLDRAALKLLGPAGRYLAGRFTLVGNLRKSTA